VSISPIPFHDLLFLTLPGITGGIALSSVSDGRISSALGVVIVAVIGVIFSLVGLRAVLSYEKYAWAIFFIVFMVMYGEVGGTADRVAPTTDFDLDFSGSALTLFAIIYGSSASWCSIVSDYYVHYPVNTSSTKVFLLTTMGVAIPTCIGMLLGSCIASGLHNNPDWSAAYDVSIGELIKIMIHPRGFAKFLLVILVLSGIGTNCIAIYSAALSIQQFARPLSIIPRFIWTFLIFVGILLLGLAGRDKLLTVLQNFLSLLGYWNTAFFVILFVEHYLFRKGHRGYQNYDLEGWNTPSKMPIGYAGLFAFLAGIAGAIIGMDETYYVGIAAKPIGAFGGDLGNQLAFVMTLMTYVPARWAEYKFVGR
jgi:purine-cytosine permease-like protein